MDSNTLNVKEFCSNRCSAVLAQCYRLRVFDRMPLTASERRWRSLTATLNVKELHWRAVTATLIDLPFYISN